MSHIDGQPLSFYGGLALSVAEIREGPKSRVAPVAFQQAHIIDAQIIIDPSQLHITALCTTRNATVLRVPFSAFHDVRRIGSLQLTAPIGGNRASTAAWSALAGGGGGGGGNSHHLLNNSNGSTTSAVGVEIEYLLQEGSEAIIGPVWRTYVCSIISTRRDTTLIERMFRALVGLFRLSRALEEDARKEPETRHQHHQQPLLERRGVPRGGAENDESAVISPHTHRPQISASALQRDLVHRFDDQPPGIGWAPSGGSFAVSPGDAPAPFQSYEVTNSNAMRELRAIQMRRQQRQEQLVGALMGGSSSRGDGARGGNRDSVAAANGYTFVNNGAGHHPFYHSSTLDGRSGGGGGRGAITTTTSANEAPELFWCRWCGEFQEGPQHARSCPNRAVECSWCGQRMNKKHFDDIHRHECRENPSYFHQHQQPSQQYGNSNRNTTAAVNPAELPPAPAPPASSPATMAAAEPTAAAATTTTPPKPKSSGRTCIWCGEDRPKSHDKDCEYRETMCKACNMVIKVKDKTRHRMECSKAPSRTIRTLGRGEDKSAPKYRHRGSSDGGGSPRETLGSGGGGADTMQSNRTVHFKDSGQ